MNSLLSALSTLQQMLKSSKIFCQETSLVVQLLQDILQALEKNKGGLFKHKPLPPAETQIQQISMTLSSLDLILSNSSMSQRKIKFEVDRLTMQLYRSLEKTFGEKFLEGWNTSKKIREEHLKVCKIALKIWENHFDNCLFVSFPAFASAIQGYVPRDYLDYFFNPDAAQFISPIRFGKVLSIFGGLAEFSRTITDNLTGPGFFGFIYPSEADKSLHSNFNVGTFIYFVDMESYTCQVNYLNASKAIVKEPIVQKKGKYHFLKKPYNTLHQVVSGNPPLSCPLDNTIMRQPEFHGILDSSQISTLLPSHMPDGTFITRYSSSSDYTISYIHNSSLFNTKIHLTPAQDWVFSEEPQTTYKSFDLLMRGFPVLKVPLPAPTPFLPYPNESFSPLPEDASPRPQKSLMRLFSKTPLDTSPSSPKKNSPVFHLSQTAPKEHRLAKPPPCLEDSASNFSSSRTSETSRDQLDYGSTNMKPFRSPQSQTRNRKVSEENEYSFLPFSTKSSISSSALSSIPKRTMSQDNQTDYSGLSELLKNAQSSSAPSQGALSSLPADTDYSALGSLLLQPHTGASQHDEDDYSSLPSPYSNHSSQDTKSDYGNLSPFQMNKIRKKSLSKLSVTSSNQDSDNYGFLPDISNLAVKKH